MLSISIFSVGKDWKDVYDVRVFLYKENKNLSSSAIGIGGWAQGGPPRLTDTMAVVQGEAMSLDFLIFFFFFKENESNELSTKGTRRVSHALCEQ